MKSSTCDAHYRAVWVCCLQQLTWSVYLFFFKYRSFHVRFKRHLKTFPLAECQRRRYNVLETAVPLRCVNLLLKWNWVIELNTKQKDIQLRWPIRYAKVQLICILWSWSLVNTESHSKRRSIRAAIYFVYKRRGSVCNFANAYNTSHFELNLSMFHTSSGICCFFSRKIFATKTFAFVYATVRITWLVSRDNLRHWSQWSADVTEWRSWRHVFPLQLIARWKLVGASGEWSVTPVTMIMHVARAVIADG